MRKGYSKQGRLDTERIDQVPLNLECRDEIIPVLRALQHLYSTPEDCDQMMKLVAQDVNGESRSDCGREGMDYWHILVLASVRLGCNLKYDRLQDLAENHRRLRGIMGIGEWDEKTSFCWQRIRDNVCLLSPVTIDAISQIIVAAGHAMVPDAIETVRADSFVMETRIHYPTESTLIRDGVRKIISICSPLAETHAALGWRQQQYLWLQVKRTSRAIDRIAGKKGPNYKPRLRKAYQKLLQQSQKIVRRARELCAELNLPTATESDLFGDQTLQAFIARTERVQTTAKRRVIDEETVPNSDKLFSMFEPHTQMFKRGKASEPVQFGRQVLVYEDGAGFLIHHCVMPRDKGDKDVAVEQTKIVQQRFANRIRRLSFDRGFHSPENQEQLSAIVPCLCLPKPGAKQSVKQLAEADDEFLAARQNHSGVESAIGSLQSGNGQKRCRDRTELGYARYISLGILGRNLHTLGRLLIAQEMPECEAAHTRRAA
jgi:IS5 family transposase